eukprot:14905986-Ditylum_brightwellii.AAC.1
MDVTLEGTQNSQSSDKWQDSELMTACVRRKQVLLGEAGVNTEQKGHRVTHMSWLPTLEDLDVMA